jgi:hypothetical protein
LYSSPDIVTVTLFRIKIAFFWDGTSYSLVYWYLFTKPHGVTSQKIRIFIIVAVKVSNPTELSHGRACRSHRWNENCMSSIVWNISKGRWNLGDRGIKWRAVLSWIVENSSVGIAMGYGLDALGSIPSREQDSSLLNSVQTDSEANTVSYAVGT